MRCVMVTSIWTLGWSTGDGRAINLGEINGKTIQLKGAGPSHTPEMQTVWC